MKTLKILLALLIISFAATAKKGQLIKKRNIKYLSIKVRVSDATVSDTLKINLYTLISNKRDQLPDNISCAVMNKSGLFVFKIPVSSSYGYFEVTKKIPVSKVTIESDNAASLTEKFYWTAKDSIRINLIKVRDTDVKRHIDRVKDFQISFSGKGALKYQIKLSADSIYEKYRQIHPSQFDHYATNGRDSVIKFLENKKNGLSKTDIEVLKADYLFRNSIPNFHSVLGEYKAALDKDKNLDVFAWCSQLRAYHEKLMNQVTDAGLARSRYFPEYAQYEAETEYLIRHKERYLSEFTGMSSVNLDSVLKIIVARYHGEVRDKVISHLFFGGLEAKNAIRVKQQALQAISNANIKRQLNILLNPQAEGSQAYQFNLPDTSGKYHSLLSLKGKIVYQDFYFTGCGGCAGLYEDVLKEVEDHYKDNPNVVFVSVNAVVSLNNIKSGIKSGKYNSPSGLNLYTDGKGYNHEMLSYYGVTEFPTTLLIDKNGKIARYNTEDIKTKDGLIKRIDRLLK